MTFYKFIFFSSKYIIMCSMCWKMRALSLMNIFLKLCCKIHNIYSSVIDLHVKYEYT